MVAKANEEINVEKYNRFKKIKILRKRKKWKKKEKCEGGEENSTELQKPNVEAEVYDNNRKCDWIYTYTYTPISKIRTVQQKLSTIDWPSKQRKPKIISTRKKTN